MKRLDTRQLDMFATLAPPPAPAAPPPRAPSLEDLEAIPPTWRHALEAAPYRLRLNVSAQATGIVAEVLDDGGERRLLLADDRQVAGDRPEEERAGDRVRTLIRTPEAARELHRRRALRFVRWLSCDTGEYELEAFPGGDYPPPVLPPIAQH